jgi:hypothetical protein
MFSPRCKRYFVLGLVSLLLSLALDGLFGSAGPKEIAQFHSRFVKLRFAVAD